MNTEIFSKDAAYDRLKGIHPPLRNNFLRNPVLSGTKTTDLYIRPVLSVMKQFDHPPPV